MAKIYQGTIRYADHSSYLFNDANLEKCSQVMADGIKFYREFNIREATIEAMCDKCYNDGFYRKPTRNKLVYKQVKCDCNLKYTDEKIEVKY